MIQIGEDEMFSKTIDLPAVLRSSGGTLLVNLADKSAMEDIMSHPDVARAVAGVPGGSSSDSPGPSNISSLSGYIRFRGGLINYGDTVDKCDLTSSVPDPLRYLVIQESTNPGFAGQVGSVGVVRFENAEVVEKIMGKICDDHDASITYEHLHSVASSLVVDAANCTHFSGIHVAELVLRAGGAVTALQQAGVSTIFLGNEPSYATSNFCQQVSAIRLGRESIKVAIWLIDAAAEELFSFLAARTGAVPNPLVRGNFGILLLGGVSVARCAASHLLLIYTLVKTRIVLNLCIFVGNSTSFPCRRHPARCSPAALVFSSQ